MRDPRGRSRGRGPHPLQPGVRPVGTATGRARVYDDLPQQTKERIEGLQAEHDLFYALQRNGVQMKDDMLGKLYPRTPNPLVRTSANGRKALYLGWHAVNIVGWDEADGRKLLDELYAFATQDK